jgi:hypothetical protein
MGQQGWDVFACAEKFEIAGQQPQSFGPGFERRLFAEIVASNQAENGRFAAAGES